MRIISPAHVIMPRGRGDATKRLQLISRCSYTDSREFCASPFRISDSFFCHYARAEISVAAHARCGRFKSAYVEITLCLAVSAVSTRPFKWYRPRAATFAAPKAALMETGPVPTTGTALSSDPDWSSLKSAC